MGFPGGLVVKNLSAMEEIQVQALGWEDPLTKGMATHSSIPTWKIPWTEESTVHGVPRVRHDLVTKQQQNIKETGGKFPFWDLKADIGEKQSKTLEQ